MLYIIIIIIALVGIWVWFVKGGNYLPGNIDSLLKEVKSQTIPNLIEGKTGYVDSDGVSIFYNISGNQDANAETILLINGLTHTLLDWPPYFMYKLVEKGYRVIRYDNRGVGMSDHLSDWSRENGFTLHDMARDALAVLQHLHISKAHLVGVSMGGMIAQEVAIHYPQYVGSLTSIMSTGFFYDPALANQPKRFTFHMIRLITKYKKELYKEDIRVKFHLATQRLLKGGGDYDFHDRWTIEKAYYEIRKRKGFNPKAVYMHGYAIKKSGSRYEALQKIQIPTLVIHGKDDPLILFEHAPKYANLIPNAETLYIDGMGHDLPELYIDQVLESIAGMI